MVTVILLIVASIISGILAYQDFRTRLIRLELLLVLFILFFSAICIKTGVTQTLICYAKSSILISIVIGILWLYTRIRFGGRLDFFNQAFAWGDILYLIAVGGIFTLTGLSVFLIISSLSAIISTLIFAKVKRQKVDSIPFVTYMSFTLVPLLGILLIGYGNFKYLADTLLNINLVF